jgi:hypothetical protein
MITLKNIYENKLTFPTFFERKIKIKNKFTILFGAKSTGKTFLIYDYLLNSNKNYLYIDMLDYKFSISLLDNIQEFIKSENIEILVIENYNYQLKLPKVNSIILSTYHYKSINNFIPLQVMPLDFEEYLLFDIKHQNTVNSFNSFLKYGNIPDIIDYKDFKKHTRNQELLELYEKNETALDILKILIKSSGEFKSPFWLYTILKKNIKISKDYLYNKIKQYENNSIIFFLSKYMQPKAVKRIFCFNHSLIDIVSSDKKFSNQFSNMIFLELKNRYDELYYLDGIDFYIPSNNNIVICMPFFNKITFSQITNKLLKSISTIEITSITIVTVNNYDTLYLDDIQCDILPFFEWSLTI